MPGCFWKSIEVANFPNFRLHLCQRLNPWIQWWLSKVMQWIDLDEIMNRYYHYHYYYYVYYFYLSHYYYYWNDLKYLKASKRKVGNRIRSFDAWNPVSQLWTRRKKKQEMVGWRYHPQLVLFFGCFHFLLRDVGHPKAPRTPQIHMESHGPENEKGLKFSNASFLYSKVRYAWWRFMI